MRIFRYRHIDTSSYCLLTRPSPHIIALPSKLRRRRRIKRKKLHVISAGCEPGLVNQNPLHSQTFNT